MSITLRVGIRFLRIRDKKYRVSLGLTIIGIALAAVSVQVAFASFAVVDHRKEVGLARSVTWAEEGEPVHVWVRDLRHAYDRRVLFRTDIATDGGEIAHTVSKPPGVEKWPEVGELIVSPQFAKEVKTNEELAGYAPGEIVGTIGEAGLRAPDELVVYRGVERAEVESSGTPAAGFGGRYQVNSELVDSQVQGLALLFLTCLGLPVVAFLMVAARLSVSTRQRRIATLRLMGVSARQAARVNGVEQLVVGIAGGVLALAVYPVVNRLLAGSGVLVMRWFPETTSIDFLGTVTLLSSCAGLSWLVGSRTAAEAIRSPWRRRREVPPSPPQWWCLLPLVVGAALLWILFWRGYFSDTQAGAVRIDTSWMITAVLLTGVGLLIAASPLTALVGRWWGSSRGLNRRLGATRAAFDARSSGRLAAGVLVLVFAIGIGIGHSRDARATSELEPGAPAVFSAGAAEIDVTQAKKLLEIEEPYVRALSGTNVQTGGPVLFMDCQGIRGLLGKNLPNCALKKNSGYRVADRTTDLQLSGRKGETYRVPMPADQLKLSGELPGGDQLLDFDAVLPLDGELAYATYDSVMLVAKSSDMDKVMSQFVSIAPYSQPSVFGENPAQAVNNMMLGAYIRLAFVLGSLVGLMALVIALLDRAVQRRRVNARMLAQGMRPGQLRAVQAWEAVASIVPQVTVAWALGIVGAMTWQYTGGLIREPDWEAFGWLTLGTLVAMAGTVALSALTTPRRVDPQLLRAE